MRARCCGDLFRKDPSVWRIGKKKTRMKKRILTILIIATITFAWIHSLMPGEVSSDESGFVFELLAPVLKLILPDSLVTEHLIRKLAHFSEYAVLGVELALYVSLVYNISLRNYVRIIYFGATAAFIDETIQIFSGRGPAIADVWIDIAGCTLGAGIVCLIYILRYRPRKK